ncbi:MAG: IS200/IS605 family transposase, partial [Thermoflexibacter sp.]|nr:IS200/IS605 family transposase [Thermoflexibacter sp.]
MQSYVKIWVHTVFSTKNRQPLISSKIEAKVHQLLKDELITMGCFVQIINGMEDHVHLLFLLNNQKSIAEVMKNVKGATSHTINQENMTHEKFAWQGGYGALSVSDRRVGEVEKYIKNQQ